jgi:hypothetical protein
MKPDHKSGTLPLEGAGDGGLGGDPRRLAGIRPLLDRGDAGDAWTAGSLAAFAALVFGPTVVQLSWDRAGRLRFWILAVFLTAILAGMAAYAGWSVAGMTRGMADDAAFPFWLAATVIALGALPAVQAGGGVSYAEWFRGVTRAGLLVLQAALFAGIGWLLLRLSAELFDVIGIGLIERLIEEDYVLWPLLWMLAGVGAQALLPDALDWMRRQILLVLSWLQPIAVVIAVAFLGALPFTGLQALWSTGSAAALLLGLASALVLLIAATLQTGERAVELPGWRIWSIIASVVAVPIYVALAGYALALRVAQHGWSVDRVWAAFVVGAVGLLALGYLGVMAARPRAGIRWLGTVNLVVLAVVVVGLVLLHSPPLDPKAIAARSQVARLLAGKENAVLFDYGYLRFNLGRPGDRALRQLSAIEQHGEAEAIRRCSADVLLQQRWIWNWQCRGQAMTVAEARAKFTVYPLGGDLDEDLLKLFIETSNEVTPGYADCRKASEPCPVLHVDLNGDGATEYVLMANSVHGRVFSRSNGAWKEVGWVEGHQQASAEPTLTELLKRGPIEAADKPWDDLRIGDRVYQLYP